MKEIEKAWNMLKSDDVEEYNKGISIIIEALKNNAYIYELRKKLPKIFLDSYTAIDFHDFMLVGILFNKEDQQIGPSIRLQWYDYYETYGENLVYEILYEGISYYKIFGRETLHPVYMLVNIFDMSEEGFMIHRILGSDGMMIEIGFGNIKIRKLLRQSDF